ncbi:MAG: PAS domain-containing protein [Sphingomonadaceae bacterium]
MAHRIAVAVVDAGLLERAHGQQRVVARIADALAGEVEVRRIAQTAVDLALAELSADVVVLWKARTEARELELLASSGLDPSEAAKVARLSFDAPSLAALTARTRRTHVIESLDKLPHGLEITKGIFTKLGVQSVVNIPLLARGELVGVFAYARKVPRLWEREQQAIAGTLADLLAAALLNAGLYEESERRRLLAETVIDNSPAAISVISGPEHRYVLVNPARERISGLPRERLLGHTLRETFPDLAGEIVEKAIERVYRTGKTEVIPEFHYDFGPPKGPRDLSLLYAPLRGPNGKIEGVISLMLDITEQVASRRQLEEIAAKLKAANEQLVEANLRSSRMADLAQQRAAELAATINNIADAVFVCDPEGKIIFINGAALDLIGAERSGALRTLVEYIAALRPRYLDGRPIPREELSISKALRGEVVRGVEEIVRDSRMQRDRFIQVSAAPVRDAEGRLLGAVEVMSDITRLKELDRLKDEFITVAAHEIKTPVTAIKGFAQTLLRTPNACLPRFRVALETIVQQSDRIDTLVRDFLEASRMRWGRVQLSPERVNLSAIVSEAVARKAAEAPRHQLELSAEDPVWVVGDRMRLYQVMDALLDNAVQYSPGGGKVEVQVRKEGSRAVVSVIDHGVGIPKERQSHLFERFYRAHIGTSYDYGGLGIELYIAREIVRRHGGDIWFESEEGKGSTFHFSVPLASDE